MRSSATRCSSERFSSPSSRRMAEYPMMTLSGVRSSCERPERSCSGRGFMRRTAARRASRTPISSSTTRTRDRSLITSGHEQKTCQEPRRLGPRFAGAAAAPPRAARSCLNARMPGVAHARAHAVSARARAAPPERAGALLAMSWPLSPLRGLDAQLVHAVLEDAPGRPEQLGGARLVEVRLPEGLDDDLALELVDRVAERPPALEDLLPDGARVLLAAPHLVGQILRPDRRPLREHEQALDQVLELAHVPGPVVAHEDVDRLGLEGLLPDAHVVRLLLPEAADQEQEVVAPLAQRGQVHGHHVETVVEVGAERALLQAARRVAVGGRDDAHVDADRLGAAHAQELAVLEDAQQLGLRPWTHLADLVQEERALVGQLELPELARVGVGERALLVPEELALEERLGDG